MGASTEPEYLKDVLDTYHISGVRYNKSNADVVYEQNKVLQGHSKYPVLMAANTEAGGDGAANDGTYIGHEVKLLLLTTLNTLMKWAVLLVLKLLQSDVTCHLHQL